MVTSSPAPGTCFGFQLSAVFQLPPAPLFHAIGIADATFGCSKPKKITARTAIRPTTFDGDVRLRSVSQSIVPPPRCTLVCTPADRPFEGPENKFSGEYR